MILLKQLADTLIKHTRLSPLAKLAYVPKSQPFAAKGMKILNKQSNKMTATGRKPNKFRP